MKKLGAILFGIVFILGLSIVTAPAQQVETVDPDGVDSSDWRPTPTADILADILNDWDADDADSSYVTADDWYSLTVDFVDLTGGPYTAIKVKFRASSGWGPSDVRLGI